MGKGRKRAGKEAKGRMREFSPSPSGIVWLAGVLCLLWPCNPGYAEDTDAEPSATAEQSSSAKGGPSGENAVSKEDEGEAGETRRLNWIHGSFEAGFDGEWSRDDSDIDFDQTLRLTITPPQTKRLQIRGTLQTRKRHRETRLVVSTRTLASAVPVQIDQKLKVVHHFVPTEAVRHLW